MSTVLLPLPSDVMVPPPPLTVIRLAALPPTVIVATPAPTVMLCSPPPTVMSFVPVPAVMLLSNCVLPFCCAVPVPRLTVFVPVVLPSTIEKLSSPALLLLCVMVLLPVPSRLML